MGAEFYVGVMILCLVFAHIARNWVKNMYRDPESGARNIVFGKMHPFYPRYFCTIPRWLKKYANLPVNEIPNFAWVRLYLSVFLGVLAPVSLVVGFVAYFLPQIEIIYVCFIQIVCVFLMAEIPSFLVNYVIWQYVEKKRAPSKKEKQ